MTSRQPAALLFLAGLLLIVCGADASGQTTVRVTTDSAIIWRPGFMAPATIVKLGTELLAVSKQGDWYEVVLPRSGSTPTETGLIAIGQVRIIAGPPPPERPRARGMATEPERRPARPTIPPRFGIRGFAQFGYGWFTARKTFKAMTGQPGALWFGGGGEMRLKNGVFVQAAVQRLRRTGERVFISNDEVFELGIADTITITPIEFTGGYRVTSGHTTGYAGAGAGRYFYKEQWTFADPSEIVDRQFASYHALAGAEWRHNEWVSSSVELQYTHVPNEGRSSEVAAFVARNLGGLALRAKIVVGK